MKYFFDTEFIECFKRPIKWLPTIGNFNKPYHSIQLISIGIVCEDGRTYYAISKEYDYSDASDWVRENVILPIYQALTPAHKQFSEPSNFHKYEGKINCEIAAEIIDFCRPISKKAYEMGIDAVIEPVDFPEFYAYYADYDWVVFCFLFGTMMNLPKGFPMYCRDLKQMVDEKAHKLYAEHCDAEHQLLNLKTHPMYPIQQNEHNALDDAKWNFELYKFLRTF